MATPIRRVWGGFRVVGRGLADTVAAAMMLVLVRVLLVLQLRLRLWRWASGDGQALDPLAMGRGIPTFATIIGIATVARVISRWSI